MRLSDFLSEVGRPVSYYPALVELTDSVTATLLLCQLIYWCGKQDNAEGWIYKTQEEIKYETGLSRAKQETARKVLKDKGGNGFNPDAFRGCLKLLKEAISNDIFSLLI